MIYTFLFSISVVKKLQKKDQFILVKIILIIFK